VPASSPPTPITELLVRWRAGDRAALDELMPLVYAELRRIANGYMRRERRVHNLQTSALINEAYLRIAGQEDVAWQNRAHFFGVASQAMRRVLVDHARQRDGRKRGGGQYKLGLDEAGEVAAGPDAEIVALNEALEELARLDPRKARTVELRYFGGLSLEETAAVLNVGHATVERDWKMARAWLMRELAKH